MDTTIDQDNIINMNFLLAASFANKTMSTEAARDQNATGITFQYDLKSLNSNQVYKNTRVHKNKDHDSDLQRIIILLVTDLNRRYL
jgi:hypothetical protein